MGQLQELNPEMVVALGKQAGEALGELADLIMPHPHAALKHGDKGEVLRKTSMLLEVLSAQCTDCGCDRGLLGEEIRCRFSRPTWKGDWFTA